MQKTRKILFISNGVLLIVAGIVVTVLSFIALNDYTTIEKFAKKLFYFLGKTDASTEYKPVLMITQVLVGLVLSRGVLSIASGIYSLIVSFFSKETFEDQKLLINTVSILTLIFANILLGIFFVVIAFVKFEKENKVSKIKNTEVVKEENNG